jgi:hypothetical protein
MLMPMRFGIVATALVLGAVAAPAQAAPDDDSAFQITPYVWASGFGGTLRPLPGSPTFRVSRSFGELLEDVDLAFFVSGLARTGRFVVVADLSHNSGSKEGLVPTPIPGVPVVPAEGRLKQTSATLLGGVRAVNRSDVTVDLLAGVRAFWLRTSIEAPALGVQRSPTVSFVDPVVAARINARIADGWSVIVYGDFGGLGAGSDFTAQAAATVNARVTPRLWLSGGYRFLMVDYETSRSRADLHMGGPTFGATFTF